MRLSSARGTKSRTVSVASRARFTAWCCDAWALSSARAMASSWFTMWAALWLERAICCNDFFSAFGSFWPASISRCASSACMRSPASGVLS